MLCVIVRVGHQGGLGIGVVSRMVSFSRVVESVFHEVQTLLSMQMFIAVPCRILTSLIYSGQHVLRLRLSFTQVQ